MLLLTGEAGLRHGDNPAQVASSTPVQSLEHHFLCMSRHETIYMLSINKANPVPSPAPQMKRELSKNTE
jgi:hypothetical protein